MNSNKVLSVFVIVMILAVSLATTKVKASSSTLADTLNSIINNVDWTDANPYTSTWGIILANQNLTTFDRAISQNIIKGDYINALYVARLAELNEYNSTAISEGTRTALQQISMCGSLPINCNASVYGDPDNLNQGCFLVYNRFLIWAYKYAEEQGLTSKWDKNQAFADFASSFDKPPINSASGEMLWCDPQENWTKSYSSRYYDEHAETLSVFLKFYEIGVQEALAYADKAWTGVQSHWNGQYYGYTGTSIVECEMGNFARIIGEYRQEKGGNIPNWERVIQDLNYTLLANGWNSPGWASPGVIVHAESNRQLRLWETLGAITALHQFFPNFTSSMKTSFANLLMGQTSAWEGLIESNLNDHGNFSGVYPRSQPSNEATACAAAILFLEGIVPVTGNLAIPIREENYPPDTTPFLAREFKFDYGNHKIRIPVNAGELTFVYGSSPVSYNFTADGVYDIEFTSDWNQIESVNGQRVALTPAQPQKLEAAEGNASVSLSWSPPLSNGGAEVTSYKIYKGSAPGAEDFFKEVEKVLSCIDTEVTYGETYYYRITAVNSFGESESSNEANATLSGPTTTHAYDGLWHTSDFSIYLNAADPSGVSETYYRINGGSVQRVSIDGQPQITLESDANTLEYWSVDSVGNEELPHKMLTQIKLDKTTPTGSIQINDGASSTTSTSVTLSLTSADTTSGVYQVRFSNDGVWDTEQWETPSSTKTWTLAPGDGEKTVHYQIEDKAGLVSSYNDSITLDATAPVANAGQTKTVSAGSPASFDASNSVDNMGIASYLWAFGDGTTGTGITTTHTYSSSGTYTATLTVQDAAGNTATTTVTIVVQTPQPTTSPSPTPSPSP
jgi:PKD repeat protein